MMRARLLMTAVAGALLASCSVVSASHSTPAPSTADTPTTVAAPGVGADGALPAPTEAVQAPIVSATEPAATQPLTASVSVPVTVGEQNARGCGSSGRSAVIDRRTQRAWLCKRGTVTAVFPITSANDQPDPGHYKVYAKDLKAYSTAGGHYSTMTHFVAFTRGKHIGARIAFHSVPKFRNGNWVQPLSSVGELGRKGETSGCIRVLPDDAVLIWDTLRIGDSVVVVS